MLLFVVYMKFYLRNYQNKIKLRYKSKRNMKKKEIQLEKLISSSFDPHISGIP